MRYDKGSQALVDTTNVIQKSFRESDAIVRIDGDEFALGVKQDE